MAKVENFRFWCQKVLPLVYDDSLSYYELLCKIVTYLNNTISAVNENTEDVANLLFEFNELKTFVDNYFYNLDVQNEINNKLDRMAEDGTLDKLLLSYFNNYKQEIDTTVNTQNSKISVLEQRMDTFSTLTEGSTTGDAELLDIRVKADGTTATSAGNSVREQVSELKSDLDDISESTKNLWPYGNLSFTRFQQVDISLPAKPHYVISGDVASGTSESGTITFIIKLSDGTTFNSTITNNTRFSVEYGGNKEIIALIFYSANGSSASVGIDASYSNIMIEEGTDATEYIKHISAKDSIARDRLSKVEETTVKVANDINILDKSVTIESTFIRETTTLVKYEDFVKPYAFKDDGGIDYIHGSSRPSTDFINVSKIKGFYIKYYLCGLREAGNILNTISFFDSDKNYISGFASKQNGIHAGDGYIPDNAVYMVATSELSQLNDSFIECTNKNAFENYVDKKYSNAEEVVNVDMSKEEFVSAINAKWEAFSLMNRVKSYSFISIDSRWEMEKIYSIINKNFRNDVVSNNYTFSYNCQRINYYFTVPIYRFCDAKLNTNSGIDFSLSTGLQGDEPSVIISDDCSTMYLYAHLKRIETKDGVNWSEPTNVVLTGSVSYLMHIGINYIDGIYYLIGTQKSISGDLFLFTSTDGLNFNEVGKIFNAGAVVSGETVNDWGNPYLIKEYGSGKFYLYIEYETTGTTWRISLATCTDITQVNDNGTVGNWVTAQNPIISTPWIDLDDGSAGLTPVGGGGIRAGAGNADFAKGSDNRPIKYNNKYYMYFHSTKGRVANLMRAYSENLVDWTVENLLLDNRDTPLDGDLTSGNADHCIIEFKGRTYLFYSWNINTPNHQPTIKYMVDDRPMLEMLKLRP